MSGILKIINKIRDIAPLSEPRCDSQHHKRKREVVHEAFDVDELLMLLNDKGLFKDTREREILVATLFLTRRSIVRLTNSRYFDDINLIAPAHTKIRELEREILIMKHKLDQLESKCAPP